MRRLAGLGIAIAAAASVFGMAAPAAAESAALPGKMVMTIDGPAIVTPEGMSLYSFYNEAAKPNGTVDWQCLETAANRINDQQSGLGERPNIGFKLIKACQQKYRPYAASADAKPAGDYTIVTRKDGTRQWAYRGAPLYFANNDAKPGDRHGVAVGGLFGGGGGNNAAFARFGGVYVAMAPMDIPAGLKLARLSPGLVIATTASDRPLYTPRGGAQLRMAGNRNDGFKPVVAPAIASVSGDWSIVDAAAGIRQYAFRGQALYAAPPGLTEDQIAATEAWDPVTVVKAPERPGAIGTHFSLVGDVYTDRKGHTLYTYGCTAGGFLSGARGAPVICEEKGDPAAFMVAVCGESRECAKRWRPYLAPANAKPEGEFSIVDITYPMFTDPRGALYPDDAPKVKVWAYRGRPLFTYYEDNKPGDIWGDQVGGLWGSIFSALVVTGRSAINFEF